MSVQRQPGACPTGKIRFHSRKRCRTAIDTVRNRIHLAAGRHRELPRIWPYRCEQCRGWHMTRRDPATWQPPREQAAS